MRGTEGGGRLGGVGEGVWREGQEGSGGGGGGRYLPVERGCRSVCGGAGRELAEVRPEVGWRDVELPRLFSCRSAEAERARRHLPRNRLRAEHRQRANPVGLIVRGRRVEGLCAVVVRVGAVQAAGARTAAARRLALLVAVRHAGRARLGRPIITSPAAGCPHWRCCG